MNEENILLGKKIRIIRENQKLSRERLAEMANISTQFLADIETGKKGMSVTTLKKICEALCVSSDYMIFNRENNGICSLDAMLASLPEEKHKDVEQIMQMIIKVVN